MFSRTVMKKLRRLAMRVSDCCCYTMRFGNIRLRRRGGFSHIKRWIYGASQEERFITSLDLQGKTVYDIGGYVGVLSVVFAKKARSQGRVITFEPNPRNVSRIQEHLRMNQIRNATVLQLGISDQKQEDLVFLMRPGEEATGSLDPQIQESFRKCGDCTEIRVQTDRLDHVISEQGLTDPDFIKIDIEGLEYPDCAV